MFRCDRHLLGLQLTAQELELEIPELFKDPAYARSNRWTLSTSQVSNTLCNVGEMSSLQREGMSDAYEQAAFGPAVDDGYGICYCVLPNRMTFNITSSLYR